MKKVLLGVLSLISISAMAQSFTADDTLSSGDAQLYYTADSSAADMNAVTGSGVTWDYSTLLAYDGVTNLDTVKNAIDSPDFGDYPQSVYHDDLSGGASVFFKNFADSVLSYGFMFTIDGNLVKIMHDVDAMKMMNLPMSLGDSFTDSTYGNADVYGSAATTAGQVVVTADGTGTLILGTTTFTGVIRIKTVETIETTITLPPPLNTITGVVTRTAFNYYDLANQNEPVFIHGNIDVASTAFNGGYSAVYSSVALPPVGSGIGTNEIANFDIFPNPATELVSIVTDKADKIEVINALGQIVYTISKPQNNEQINVAEFENGIYMVKIQKGDASSTQKLIVR